MDAYPSKTRRIHCWDHLLTLVDSFLGPWMCCGDFNCITSQVEKKGGRPFVK